MDISSDKYADNSDLRMSAARRFIKWANIEIETAEEFAEFMGFKNYGELFHAHNRETDGVIHSKLLALDGPHGYAIYKMLLARKEQPDD